MGHTVQFRIINSHQTQTRLLIIAKPFLFAYKIEKKHEQKIQYEKPVLLQILFFDFVKIKQNLCIVNSGSWCMKTMSDPYIKTEVQKFQDECF